MIILMGKNFNKNISYFHFKNDFLVSNSDTSIKVEFHLQRKINEKVCVPKSRGIVDIYKVLCYKNNGNPKYSLNRQFEDKEEVFNFINSVLPKYNVKIETLKTIHILDLEELDG